MLDPPPDPPDDPPDDPPETIEQRLRDARRAAGLTQQQVADRLGVSRRAVSEWETGNRQPHVALPGLAALYGVSTTFLLYGVEPSSVELRELRADVLTLIEKHDALSEELALTRRRLVDLAEATERVFAEQRSLLELLSSEVRRSVETRPDDPPNGQEQRRVEP